MNEISFLQSQEAGKALPATVPEIYLGTVGSADSSGVEITLDGESEPMTKRYKALKTGQELSENTRVMVVKISGTYVVLGEISATSS